MATTVSVPPVQTKATVVSNDQVMPGVNLLWLEAPEMAMLASPGQFAMLKCGQGTFLRRPLSIHRLNSDKTRVAFLFAVVGPGTAWLADIKPDCGIDVLGPLGHGFSLEPGTQNLVLVAGGLGLAPLRFLADTALAGGKSVTLFLGAATSAQLCPESMLPASAECIVATEDGSRGFKGYVTGCASKMLPRAGQIFACGPTPMFRTLAGDATLHNTEVQISLELRMACGLGICYGCSVNTRLGMKQVCKDGPVFNLHDIIWEELADI